jgi:hypothetical protein
LNETGTPAWPTLKRLISGSTTGWENENLLFRLYRPSSEASHWFPGRFSLHYS